MRTASPADDNKKDCEDWSPDVSSVSLGNTDTSSTSMQRAFECIKIREMPHSRILRRIPDGVDLWRLVVKKSDVNYYSRETRSFRAACVFGFHQT